jgi:hypothetical protein
MRLSLTMATLTEVSVRDELYIGYELEKENCKQFS